MEWTKEQMEAISYANDKNVLIRGVAGSGKTMVLAERAIRLRKEALANGERGRVAILTYNHAILRAVRHYLREKGVGQDEIVLTTLTQAVSAIHKKVCHRVTDVIENFINMESLEKIWLDHGNRRRNRLQNKKFLPFLAEELAWMSRHHIRRFGEYESVVRYGRESLALSLEERRYVYNICADYFNTLDMGVCYVEDVYNQLYTRRTRITEEDRFDYVLVDDIQDMPVNRIKVLPEICNYSYTAAGDYSQRMFSQGSPWMEAKDFLPANVITLSKSFRSSPEIMGLADSLLSKNRLLYADVGAYLPPEVMAESGDSPVVYRFDTYEEEKEKIAKWAGRMKFKYPNDTIAILVPTNAIRDKIRMEMYKNGIQAQRIDTTENNYDFNPGIKVATLYSVKGLTFDHVICANVDTEHMLGARGKEWPSLRQDAIDLAATAMYVGMTRARKTLWVTYSREMEKAPFLKNLNKKLFIAKDMPGSEEDMMYRIRLGCPNGADMERLLGRKVNNLLRGPGIIDDTDKKHKLIYVTFNNGTIDVFPARALSKGGLQLIG